MESKLKMSQKKMMQDLHAKLQQYLLFTLHLLKVFQSSLCLGSLVQGTHCLGKNNQSSLINYVN